MSNYFLEIGHLKTINMELQIKYYGMLAEISQCDEELLNFDGTSASDLLHFLTKRYPSFATKDIKVAQNNEIVPLENKITSSVIALLPPFSGG